MIWYDIDHANGCGGHKALIVTITTSSHDITRSITQVTDSNLFSFHSCVIHITVTVMSPLPQSDYKGGATLI